VQKILGIIVARKGSKGLKNKNIKIINGKPLIYWSIKQAKKSKLLTRLIVNTDSTKVIQIAKKLNVEVPFRRPRKLSTSQSLIFETLKYTINFFKKKNIFFKYIALIEPTSPLRERNDIDNILKFFFKKKIKSLVTMGKVVCQHPDFLFKLSNDNKLLPFTNFKNASSRRQNIRDLYFPDGTLYVSDVKTLLKKKSFYHEQTYGVVLPKWKNIEIDDQLDFDITEMLMKKNISRL